MVGAAVSSSSSSSPFCRCRRRFRIQRRRRRLQSRRRCRRAGVRRPRSTRRPLVISTAPRCTRLLWPRRQTAAPPRPARSRQTVPRHCHKYRRASLRSSRRRSDSSRSADRAQPAGREHTGPHTQRTRGPRRPCCRCHCDGSWSPFLYATPVERRRNFHLRCEAKCCVQDGAILWRNFCKESPANISFGSFHQTIPCRSCSHTPGNQCVHC